MRREVPWRVLAPEKTVVLLSALFGEVEQPRSVQLNNLAHPQLSDNRHLPYKRKELTPPGD